MLCITKHLARLPKGCFLKHNYYGRNFRLILNVFAIILVSVCVQVKRLGGAYGAKISRNNQIATACGLAASTLNR